MFLFCLYRDLHVEDLSRTIPVGLRAEEISELAWDFVITGFFCGDGDLNGRQVDVVFVLRLRIILWRLEIGLAESHARHALQLQRDRRIEINRITLQETE